MSKSTPPKLASRCYWKHGAWYYVDRSNVWHRLGKTAVEALQKLAELQGPARKLEAVFLRYQREILPLKGAATIKAQGPQLVTLIKVFGHMEPLAVRPMDVAAFHDALGKARGLVTANRHVALLSHVFKMARRWGDLDINPCERIGRHTERPRERYVTDPEFHAMQKYTSTWLGILMELARLVGQRESNLLRLDLAQVEQDAGIAFPAQKRGKALTVAWSPGIADVVARATAWRDERASRGTVHASRLIVGYDGQGLTVSALQSALRKMWKRYHEAVRRGEEKVLVEHFTFHDLRAKAGSESDDDRLLGHVDPRTFRRVYQRKPVSVRPVK